MAFCVSLNGKSYGFVCNLTACMKCNWKLGWVVLRVLIKHLFKVSSSVVWIPSRKNNDENFMEKDSGKMGAKCINQKYANLIFRRNISPVCLFVFCKCISRSILLLEIHLYSLDMYL